MGGLQPLTGRVALVTGGSRGLGRGIVLELAKAGADVALTYRKDRDGAEEVVAAVKAIGRRSMALPADVRDLELMENVARVTSESLGPISICISNAGIPSPGKPVADTGLNEFREVVEVHLIGAFNCARAVIPFMRRLGYGHIIFISSEVTKKCPANRGPYTCAKAGIEALARTLAVEERSFGIRVNCIAPGLIRTGYATEAARRRGFSDVEDLARALPFGRFVMPEEIGRLCVFLATDGSYISGEVIYVNGGG